MGGLAESAKHTVESVSDEVITKAEDAMEEGKNKISDIASDTKEAAETKIQDAQETMDDVVGEVENLKNLGLRE